MRIHVLAAIVALGLGGVAARAQERAPAELQRKIDRLAQPLIEGRQVVGMSIGVIKGNRVHTFHYGEVEAGSGRRANDRTVYEIGSVSKTFTGLLLADAVGRGEVKLEDPVRKYVPQVPQRGDRPITLEDLATHHSGLPRMPDNFDPADPANPYADYTVKQMLDFVAGHEPAHAAGEAYEYSNLATGLLGHVLATGTGMDYEKLMTQRIAAPLKMKDTTIMLRQDQRSRLAKPYAAVGTPSSNWDIPTLAGAGGIRSTTVDMLRYAQLHLGAGDSGRGLSVAAAMALKPRRGMGRDLKVGLAWVTARDGTTQWHNGQTGGYHSYLAVNPSMNIAVVVLANTATGVIDQFGESIMVTLAGGQVEPMKFERAVAVDRKVLEQYVGVYHITPAFALDVRLEGDQLTIQATGQQRFPVYATSAREFVYRVVEAKITFDEPDGGVVKRLVLHQNGRQMPGVRRAE